MKIFTNSKLSKKGNSILNMFVGLVFVGLAIWLGFRIFGTATGGGQEIEEQVKSMLANKDYDGDNVRDQLELLGSGCACGYDNKKKDIYNDGRLFCVATFSDQLSCEKRGLSWTIPTPIGGVNYCYYTATQCEEYLKEYYRLELEQKTNNPVIN